MNGVLLVNKSEGVTSRDVVNDICHIFKTKKVGHTGTLDPIAKGVLVVTIGRYTKLGSDLTSTFKEYVAEAEFGYLTDTLDNTGTILNKTNYIPTKEEVLNAINSFKKKYLQEVPIYSSVKVNGKKLYDYARNGEEVELPKREVEIREIEVLNIDNNKVTFRCLVSKGTYIRSLIRDIAESINSLAVMSDLTRTKQGKFNIEDSYTIDEIRNGNFKLLNIEDILDVEKIECNDKLFRLVNNGVKLENKYKKDYVLFTKNNEEICIYKRNNNLFEMHLKF